MDGFLARRVTDTRFQNERRVSGPSTGGEWYLANQHTTVSQHTFSASEYKPADSNHKMTPHKGDEGTEKKSKKLKRKKGSVEFTEGEKKRLRNRESSDDSDSGGCWYFSTCPAPNYSCCIPCHTIDTSVLLSFLQVGLRKRRRQKERREGILQEKVIHFTPSMQGPSRSRPPLPRPCAQ